VPIVKKDGTPVMLFLVKNEEESHNLTRRIMRGLERAGMTAYPNPNPKKDTDSWFFSFCGEPVEAYCPKELVRGVEAANALAKRKPTRPQRDTSNPICLLCREHCESKWGNSHGFIHYKNDDDEDVICNSCNEHEIFYRINHPTALVFLLPADVLEDITRLDSCPDCGDSSDFRVIRNRQSAPVLVEFKNLYTNKNDPCPALTEFLEFIEREEKNGREIIITARIADLEVALIGVRQEKAEREAEELAELAEREAEEPAPAEVKKPSKKERQAGSTRGANAVRDQKKKEREEFEKACEKAARAQLAIKKAADEKKRKAKAAKAKLAKACP
jgi:hypothetical protein